jgi:flagellum-specific peptidoglycan hydrolase FlgJ
MLTDAQVAGLRACYEAALQAGHRWPGMTACEAALETGWFGSGLYRNANNVFGVKQHHPPIFATLTLPTREFLGGEWVTVEADWVKYPTVADSFRDRMATLERLAPSYPNYAAALAALNAVDWITALSKTWSTDPDRGAKVISIFRAHGSLLVAA